MISMASKPFSTTSETISSRSKETLRCSKLFLHWNRFPRSKKWSLWCLEYCLLWFSWYQKRFLGRQKRFSRLDVENDSYGVNFCYIKNGFSCVVTSILWRQNRKQFIKFKDQKEKIAYFFFFLYEGKKSTLFLVKRKRLITSSPPLLVFSFSVFLCRSLMGN